MNFAIQLYSVRDALSADYSGTLAKLKEYGYAGVELFGQHHSATETKALLEAHQLEPVAHHFGLHELHSDFETCVARASTIGTKTLVCAWSMPTAEAPWEVILEQLASIASRAKSAGLGFLYHNHDHEILQTVNGKRVMDAILEITDGELDIAWVTAGGLDVTAYLQQHAQKIKQIHVKDVQKTDKWETVELGHGVVPLLATLAVAGSARWLIAEQDHSPDPMQSAKNNLRWLEHWAKGNA